MKKQGIVKDDSGRRLVTGVYCCNGHPLVTSDNPSIDGLQTIRLRAMTESGHSDIYLSPIQGDGRTVGGEHFSKGELLNLSCPRCGAAFEVLAPCYCRKGVFVALYLNPDCRHRESVVVCNSWGCKHSFIKLESSILLSGDSCGS